MFYILVDDFVNIYQVVHMLHAGLDMYLCFNKKVYLTDVYLQWLVQPQVN